MNNGNARPVPIHALVGPRCRNCDCESPSQRKRLRERQEDLRRTVTEDKQLLRLAMEEAMAARDDKADAVRHLERPADAALRTSRGTPDGGSPPSLIIASRNHAYRAVLSPCTVRAPAELN